MSLLSSAAFAYTAEQQQACTGDAFRLCGSDIPDVDRVTLCMIRNKAQLSPECRAHFGPPAPEPSLTPVAVRKPVSIKPPARPKPVSAKTRKTGKTVKPAKPAKPVAS